MNYPPRSPKHKRSRVNDFKDEWSPQPRSGNISTSRDRASSDYRDGPRNEFRYTSDKIDRPRNNRDRSSSPRNRGNRQPLGRWEDREEDWSSYQRVPPHAARPAASTYRPDYNSSPVRSPARLPPNSATRPNQQHKKKAAPPSVPGPQPNLSTDKPYTAETEATTTKHVEVVRTAEPSKPNESAKNDELAKMAGSPAEPEEAMASHMALHNQADASKEFSDFLYKLLDEATDLAALKTKRAVAEKEFNRRESDFNKTKDSHQKFPATEEVLKKSKDVAKKAFAAIDEKFKAKDASLKNIVSQGVARLLPALQLGSGGHDEGLKLQVDALSVRCLELENQLRNQQSFIENQRLARESLEKKISIYDKGLEAVKAESTETTREFREARQALGQLGEKTNGFVRKFALHDEALEALKSDIEILSKSPTKVPDDIKVTLNEISARVDSFKTKQDALSLRFESLGVLDGFHGKEEPLPIVNSKALAECVKTLESYDRKLSDLDLYVRGNGSKQGHAGLISSLVEAQSALRQEFLKTHTSWTSLVERLAEVENQTTRLDTVETRLDATEEKSAAVPSNVELVDFRSRILVVESRLNDASKRLGIVEKQTVAEQLSLTHIEQLRSLEQRIATIETHSTMPITPIPANTTPQPLPAPNDDSLLKECATMVQNMLSESDVVMGGEIDALKKTVKDIQQAIDLRQIDFYVPLSALPAKFDALSKSVTENEQAHSNYLRQIDVKFNNYAIRQQTLQQTLDNRVEAVETGVSNLDIRMSLINTKEMAIYILNQMDSTYPNLRDAQNTLVEQNTSLKRAEERIVAIDHTIKLLNGQVLSVERQLPQNPAAMAEVQALRADVEIATQLANEAKAAVAVMSKKSYDDAQVWIDNFADMTVDLSELKEKTAEVALAVKDMSTPLRNGPLPSDRTPIGNGSVFKIRGQAKQGSQGSEARHSSGEPLTKRRFPNGTPPAGSRRNGVNGSPARKRKRISDVTEPLEVVDSEDEPYQPVISEDEDD